MSVDEYEYKHYIDKFSDSDKNCYDGTTVLKNYFDIKDQEELDMYEKYFVSLELLKMREQGYIGNFDMNHYKLIHKNMFHNLFPFAGELRGTDMVKDKTYFCRSYYIYGNLERTLEEMKTSMLSIKSEDEYANKLAKYYAELNLIHPFREGNGRTLREFLRQYVVFLNEKLDFSSFELDYTKMDINALLDNTIKDNEEGLAQEFSKALIEIEQKQKSR